MADYRIYLLGVDAELLNAVTIACDDDEEAILQMKLYAGSASRMELWLDDRRILLATE
jgi:hypothetical protein